MEESASETKNSIIIDIMGLYLPRVIDFPGVGSRYPSFRMLVLCDFAGVACYLISNLGAGVGFQT